MTPDDYEDDMPTFHWLEHIGGYLVSFGTGLFIGAVVGMAILFAVDFDFLATHAAWFTNTLLLGAATSLAGCICFWVGGPRA